MMDIKYSILVVLVVCVLLAFTKYYVVAEEPVINSIEVACLVNVIAENIEFK